MKSIERSLSLGLALLFFVCAFGILIIGWTEQVPTLNQTNYSNLSESTNINGNNTQGLQTAYIQGYHDALLNVAAYTSQCYGTYPLSYKNITLNIVAIECLQMVEEK